MTPLSLSSLRSAAMAATPGPHGDAEFAPWGQHTTPPSPATILALLDALEAAQRDRDEWREACKDANQRFTYAENQTRDLRAALEAARGALGRAFEAGVSAARGQIDGDLRYGHGKHIADDVWSRFVFPSEEYRALAATPSTTGTGEG